MKERVRQPEQPAAAAESPFVVVAAPEKPSYSVPSSRGDRHFVEPATLKLSLDERRARAVELIQELFLDASEKLRKWADVTGQSAQVDAGYIAQHLVSLLTGIPGIRRRGKGLDLVDDSEVKTANSVDGIDKPRWNLQFIREDTMSALLEHPYIFLVLFDHNRTGQFRVRVWAIVPAKDEGFQRAFATWRESERLSRNYQLHPPVGRDDDIATNESGNLRLPLMFEALQIDGVLQVTKYVGERPIAASELVSVGRWDGKAGLTASLEAESSKVMAKTEGTQGR